MRKHDRITLLYQRWLVWAFKILTSIVLLASYHVVCTVLPTFVSSIYYEYSADSYKTIKFTFLVFMDSQKFIHGNKVGWNIRAKICTLSFMIKYVCHLRVENFDNRSFRTKTSFFVNILVLNPSKMLFSFLYQIQDLLV